jgi:chromosome segregation ATPase
MLIENIMYFALGLLAAGLLTLIIMPAVWRRAVRLTKKRIEAATPMTMAEFRADKDQLRAEFALSTRRLEMNVEALRKRLAEQVGDISRKKSDLATLKSDRDQHLAVVRELEEREGELRRRILELEKDGVDLAQRLRMRDREYDRKVNELESARDTIRGKLPKGVDLDGKALSGEYDQDVDELLTALAIERQRSNFLENQARSLISRLEFSDRKGTDSSAAIAEMRKALAAKDDSQTESRNELIAAEARMASAESRLNALLEETQATVADEDTKTETLLAEKLSLEEQVNQLREKVLSVESAVLSDWDSDRITQSHMRERLNDIASDVSRLVYAVDGDASAAAEESLFDKVQRFADDGRKVEEFPVRKGRANGPQSGGNGAVSERMAALRDIQGRT